MDREEVNGELASPEASFASSFRGKNSAKSADDLKKARESRAAEALRMKDEQLRILSDQNSNLLTSLDKVISIFKFFALDSKFLVLMP